MTTPIFNQLLRSSSAMLNLYDTNAQVRIWFDQADREENETWTST